MSTCWKAKMVYTHKTDSVVDIIGYEKNSMEGSQKN
jgi:hypothetical protein